MCASLLGVGDQTFRYWRENLFPFKNKKRFTSPELFTFRLFLFFIRRKGVTVCNLKKLQIKNMFLHIANNTCAELQQQIIYIDFTDNTFSFQYTPDPKVDIYSLDIYYLHLRHVVEEHFLSYECYGTKRKQ
jgi:hypothetical protein